MKTRHHFRTYRLLFWIGLLGTLVSFKHAKTQHEATAPTVHWAVLPNSSITINGSSNVNTFGCSASGTFKAEPLTGVIAKNGKSIDMDGTIRIRIDQFDCKQRMLTADLRKTLKAGQYPEMAIHFLSLDRMPLYDGGQDFITGKVIIELAGQRRPFTLRYAFTKTNQGYKLEGSRSFSFADFNLAPPQKIGGLVKVKDDFDVGFTLLLDNIR